MNKYQNVPDRFYFSRKFIDISGNKSSDKVSENRKNFDFSNKNSLNYAELMRKRAMKYRWQVLNGYN